MNKEEIINIINHSEPCIDPYSIDPVARFLFLYLKCEDRSKISGHGLDISDIDYKALAYALREILIEESCGCYG